MSTLLIEQKQDIFQVSIEFDHLAAREHQNSPVALELTERQGGREGNGMTLPIGVDHSEEPANTLPRNDSATCWSRFLSGYRCRASVATSSKGMFRMARAIWSSTCTS